MSDDAFAPPTASGVAAPSAGSPLVRGLAITAIILGVVGGLLLAFGLLGAASQSFMTEQLVATQPPQVRGAYRDLLLAQQRWMPIAVLVSLLGIGVCGAMIFGGIRALSQGALGALRIAALGAAGFDILTAITSPLFAFVLNWRAWTAYMDALSATLPDPAAQGAVTGGLFGGIGGAIAGSLFYVGMAVFWIWAAGRIGAAQADAQGG